MLDLFISLLLTGCLFWGVIGLMAVDRKKKRPVKTAKKESPQQPVLSLVQGRWQRVSETTSVASRELLDENGVLFLLSVTKVDRRKHWQQRQAEWAKLEARYNKQIRWLWLGIVFLLIFVLL